MGAKPTKAVFVGLLDEYDVDYDPLTGDHRICLRITLRGDYPLAPKRPLVTGSPIKVVQ